MEKYEIQDVTSNLAAGQFKNETLASFYRNLVEVADKSLIDAFMVGANMEGLDIYDLNNYRKDIIDNAGSQLAFAELAKGSRNPMWAFFRNLKYLDSSYPDQTISQEDLDNIVEDGKRNRQLYLEQLMVLRLNFSIPAG